MGHREDLLAGAVRCIREKGYAHTTARDIVAASGTNLASIGYHYGSTQALLNAAVVEAMREFGAEMARALGAGADADAPAAGTDAPAVGADAPTAGADAPAAGADAPALERFEHFWARLAESVCASPQVWRATFDIFAVAEHDPDVRAAVADGLDRGRMLWARMLYGIEADGPRARAVGSLHQALISGLLVQWLIDPDRAPSPADLAGALRYITDQVSTGDHPVPPRHE